MMKALAIRRYKAPMEMMELPVPRPGPGDLLVRVRAASVNPVDYKIRDGGVKVMIPYSFPLILGNDLAGDVEAVGPGVTKFKVGDAIFSRLDKDRIGAIAEYALVRESAAAKKPVRLDYVQAASVPLVGLTAWQALIDLAHLQAGQKVLIHAGSGGVGTVAIQLAKHLGAHVATTTSTANVDWVKRLGADVVVDYSKDDFEKVLRDYDVVLNSLGADVLEKSLRVLRPGGKLISISGPPDAAFAKDIGASWFLRQVMRLLSYRIRSKANRLGVSYSFLFMKASGDELREIGSLIDAGAIRPVVDQVFPFASTNEAMAYVDKGRAKGKVVVSVR